MYLLVNSLKRVKSLSLLFLTSTIISVALIFAFSLRNNNGVMDIKVVDIIVEEETEESTLFIEHLEEQGFIVEVVEKSDVLNNVLVIDKEFDEDIYDNNPLSLDYYGENNVLSILEVELNNFHMQMLGDTSMNSVISYEVERLLEGETSQIGYINIVNYVLFAFYLSMIPLYLHNRKHNNVDYREDIIGVNGLYKSIADIIAIFVACAISIFAITLVESLINGFETKKMVVIIVSQLIGVVSVYNLSLLFTNIFKKRVLLTGVTTIIQLVCGATSGSWVPHEYLPEALKYFSKINPLYMQNTLVNDLYLGNSSYSALIQIIIFNIVVAILVVISKKYFKNHEYSSETEHVL